MTHIMKLRLLTTLCFFVAGSLPAYADMVQLAIIHSPQIGEGEVRQDVEYSIMSIDGDVGQSLVGAKIYGYLRQTKDEWIVGFEVFEYAGLMIEESGEFPVHGNVIDGSGLAVDIDPDILAGIEETLIRQRLALESAEQDALAAQEAAQLLIDLRKKAQAAADAANSDNKDNASEANASSGETDKSSDQSPVGNSASSGETDKSSGQSPAGSSASSGSSSTGASGVSSSGSLAGAKLTTGTGSVAASVSATPAAKASTTIRKETSSAGCTIVVDAARTKAWKQQRTIIYDGTTLKDPGKCENGTTFYHITKNYAACAVGIDTAKTKATARYQTNYVGGDGKNVIVDNCQNDPKMVFTIVEEHNVCSEGLDHVNKTVTPKAQKAYYTDKKVRQLVDDCKASSTKPTFNMVPNKAICSFRHSYEKGLSYERASYSYTLDGLIKQAIGCSDTGVTFKHKPFYYDTNGNSLCKPTINTATGKAQYASRKGVDIQGRVHYLGSCTTDISTQETLHYTSDGCSDWRTWDHNLSAGTTYVKKRAYVVRNNNRVYLGTCAKSSELLPHQYRTVGWSMNDAQRYGQALQEVFINTSSGKEILQGSTLLAGTAQTAYTKDGVVNVPNPKPEYSGCFKYNSQITYQKMKRPDGTSYQYKVGEQVNSSASNACTPAQKTWLIKDFAIHAYKHARKFNGLHDTTTYDATLLNVTFTGIRSITREDGTIFSATSEQTMVCALSPAMQNILSINGYILYNVSNMILIVGTTQTSDWGPYCLNELQSQLNMNAGW